MNFNKHSNFEGQHAFLGASNYAWLNYTPEKLEAVWRNAQAKKRGTELHAFAAQAIKYGQKLKGSTQTMAMYVNDAIGFRMEPEQVLFYSINCFGTADTISYRKEKDGVWTLRIHDLKTGEIPASMKQLRIYAAIFCLEYAVKPEEIRIELRIYQNDAIVREVPDAELIRDYMGRIVEGDRVINQLREQEE